MVQTLPKGGKKPRIGSNSRSGRAISDAQESLNSLLNSPAITDEPEILSPSGAVRNAKGRVAGPSSKSNLPKALFAFLPSLCRLTNWPTVW